MSVYAVAVTRDREDIQWLGTCQETSLRHAICFYAKVAIYRVLLMELGDFLVQGGLEVPCRLVFQGSTRDIDKIRQMLQDVENYFSCSI